MSDSTMDSGGTLGIIAGGGELPIAIAEAALAKGRKVFFVAVEGMADRARMAPYAHEFLSLGQVGRALKALKDHGCSDITFAGRVTRPQFNAIKLDARSAMILPRVVAAALKGDDNLMRTMLSVFEEEGFRVIGSADAAKELLAPAGALGKFSPKGHAQDDIAHSWRVVDAMGGLDIGQAAVVCEGLVLAVEAAEGTDAMLARVAGLPENLRGIPTQRKGVLVKAPKPHQERRVDLPVLGAHTVELVATAGLAGIAYEANGALLVTKKTIVDAADAAGIFVCGFERKSK